jgi:hypothetical protein
VGENDESWLTALDEAKRSREGEDAKNAQFTPPTDNSNNTNNTNNGSRPGTAQTNVSNISVMTTGRGKAKAAAKAAAKGARSAANALKPPGTAPAAIGTGATGGAGFDTEAKVPATEPDELSNVTEANRILFMRHILGKMEAHADLAAAAAAQDIDNDLQATGGGGGGGGGGDDDGRSFPPTPVPKLDLGVTSMPSPVALMSTRAIEVTGPKGGLTVRSALAPDFVLATYL